ncbi:MFS transporter [Micromonospora schwarzwaldensis]|uniref:MFS transporter n=1 Tax=Micromonospora sp. DSM 45708 TaxID=3111767 RepID=UPI0031DA665E
MTGPARWLAVAQLAGSIGAGLYLAGAPVYFLRAGDLTVGQVGAGLSAAALAGIAASVPAGRLADRHGARRMSIVFVLLQALFVLLLLAAGQFWLFVPLVALVAVAEQSWDVSRDGMIAAAVTGSDRVRVSAYLRSVFNAGFALGTLAAGLVLAVDSRAAYVGMLVAVAACWVAVAGLYLLLPAWPRPASTEGARQRVRPLADLPYLLVAQVSCLTRIGETILLVGLPLWIVSATDAPRPLAAWLTGINTVLVVLLQVRVSRAGDTIPAAARLQRFAFLLLAAACPVAALTGRLPTVPAIAVLVLVAVLLTFAELGGETARWTMQFGLAPERAQARYAGVFRLGQAVPAVAGPALVTGLTGGLGAAGWLVLALIPLAGAALSGPVVAWARRTRPEPAPS